MVLVAILILTEILVPIALKQHLQARSKGLFYISLTIHITLSIWLWTLFFQVVTYKGFFDNPDHIWRLMNLAGMICAVMIPGIILILFHFTGRLFRIMRGGHIRWMTKTGMIISAFSISVIAVSTFYGRFNFRFENVTIGIKGLDKDLDGIRIVQLSDMHLACFHNHQRVLEKAMERVDALNPDLILNTGDFVSFGWREFGRNDTILSKARSRYGNFAVMGNHDFGTYHPFFTEADRRNNVLLINKMIRSSGYAVLIDTTIIVRIKEAKIGLTGIITMGSHPDISYGDLGKAMSYPDTVDLKILLSHDPNHWEKEVTSKTDIDLTLSGHTHGMQMGIYTKWFRWSPSKYFYPHWGGLFIHGDQVQYVNRGLGVLAIPLRIWMPPEITVLTLKAE